MSGQGEVLCSVKECYRKFGGYSIFLLHKTNAAGDHRIQESIKKLKKVTSISAFSVVVLYWKESSDNALNK